MHAETAQAIRERDGSLPERIGRYHIVARLGSGGMGVVYEGIDIHTGARVALKTVRVPEMRVLAGIQREIHALQHLRHPGVVRVVDRGLEGGLPWYAMELIQGKTLADEFRSRWEGKAAALGALTGPQARAQDDMTWAHVSFRESRTFAEPAGLDKTQLDAPAPDSRPSGYADTARLAMTRTEVEWTRSPAPVPAPEPAPARRLAHVSDQVPVDVLPYEDLTDLLHTLLGLAEILEVVHSAGIVHCDLKPSNIFLRGGTEPVLVDFGLVTTAHSRESLRAASDVAGTIHYIAPEQLRGEYADARSDLYAFGCILYRCLIGRPPFVGRNAAAVLTQHLYTQPVPPAALRSDVPARLSDLIMQLLAKSPRQRLGYAGDVVEELSTILQAHARSAPRKSQILYRSSFIGRAAELTQLASAVSGLARGQGSLTLVRGPSGIGKTRLLMELTRHVPAGKALIVTGQCAALELDDEPALRVEAPSIEPLGSLVQHAAMLCKQRGETATQTIFGKYLLVLASFFPELLSVPGARRAAIPTALPSDASRQRVMEALTAVLTALAAEQPVLLLLDDLQWADELTLAWLDSLIRYPADRPIDRLPVAVVGAFRDGHLPAELAQLIKTCRNSTLSLSPLPGNDIAAIIGEMLSLSETPHSLVASIAAAHGGNPFYIGELLRLAQECGVLERDRDRRWQVREKPLGPAWLAPQSIDEVAIARMGFVGQATRTVLEIAAVMGRSIDIELISEAGALPHDQVLDAMDELILRRIAIQEQIGAISFAHESFRRVAYRELSELRRRALHRAAANAIERRMGREGSLPLLAYHWSRAGVPGMAFRYLVSAAEQALAAGAQRQAQDLMTRAWSLAAGSSLHLEREELARAKLLSASAAFDLGDMERCIRLGSEVLDLYGAPLPSDLRPALVRGVLHGVLQLSGLSRVLARISALDHEQAARTHCAMALTLLQKAFVAGGKPPAELLPVVFVAANAAERTGGKVSPALSYSFIGSSLGVAGLRGAAQTYFERAQRNVEEHHDRHLRARLGVSEMIYLHGMASWPRLRVRAAELIAMGREMGAFVEWEGYLLFLSDYQLHAAGTAQITTLIRPVLESAERRDNRFVSMLGCIVGAQAAYLAGDYAQALSWLAPDRMAPAAGSNAAMHAALRSLVLLELGEHEEALHNARYASTHAGEVSLPWPGGGRHHWITAALLGLAEHAYPPGSQKHEELLAAAGRVLTNGRTAARRFPMAQSGYWLLRATYIRLTMAGRAASRAYAALAKAKKLAVHTHLLYEEAWACLEMARLCTPGSTARAALMGQAERLFARGGYGHGLRRVKALTP